MSLVEIYLRALRYLLADGKRVAAICGANVVLAGVAIAEPILFGRIVDSITEGSDVMQTVALWAGLGIFNIIAFVLVARGADRLAHARRAAVTTEAYEKLITMPLTWHQKRGSSAALHTLLRAMESLFSLWLEFMRQHLSTAVALVLLVPTAVALDLRMSVVLVALGITYFAISRVVMRRTKEGQASVERHYHTVFAHIGDTVSNVSVLQSYGRVAEETRRLRQLTQNLVAGQNPVLDWWALASALQRLSSTVSMIVVIAIGAILVSRGELRIGDVVAFTGFATLLIARLDQVIGFVNQVFDSRARLEEFYRMEDAIEDRSEPVGALEMGRVSGQVTFDNVCYRFPDSTQGVQDVSFTVEPGQTVAIVGPTGAGKTTLINLLQRVLDPQSGTISIDGINTRTVTRASLRRQIATVFQDAGLLSRSIEENIRVGREEADYTAVHEAASAAAAHDFILAKSDGYDTAVGERGSNLSGGERQRVAIARAVLKDAPILVLDEATSALDVETEENVRGAIERVRKGRTTFIIAHRLTTVRDADLVLFMDAGRVIEMGSFDELATRNGRFTSLLRAGGLLGDTAIPAPARPELTLATPQAA